MDTSVVLFITGINLILLEIYSAIFTFIFKGLTNDMYDLENTSFKGFVVQSSPTILIGLLLVIYSRIVYNDDYDIPKNHILANISGIICLIVGIVYLVIFILSMKNYIKAKQIKESFEEDENPEE